MVSNRARNPGIGNADSKTSGTMACTPRARSSELSRCNHLLLALGDAGAFVFLVLASHTPNHTDSIGNKKQWTQTQQSQLLLSGLLGVFLAIGSNAGTTCWIAAESPLSPSTPASTNASRTFVSVALVTKLPYPIPSTLPSCCLCIGSIDMA